MGLRIFRNKLKKGIGSFPFRHQIVMKWNSVNLKTLTLALLFSFTLSLFLKGAAFQPKPQEPRKKPLLSETTIHNATREAIHYTVVTDRPGEKPQKRLIKAGDIDRYPGDVSLKLTFERDKKTLIYRLNPGISCFFHYDDQNELDVWTDSSQRAQSEDLVPFVATPMDVVRKMLEMAQVDKDDILYDLGCGNGRIVIMAAKEHGARSVGIDLDPRRIKESKANMREAGVEDRVEFRLRDALKTDFSEATVITLYLLMEVNERLRPHLERQLKRGTMVISHNYPIPGWASRLVDYVSMESEDREEHSIYLYQR